MRSLLIFVLICAPFASATNHYILPSGSGTNAGTDWNNACNGFTGNCAFGSLTRGDTYYVGGNGHYAGNQIANDTASGTSVITIKGATAGDHGTATGWSNSLGVDVHPAIFDVSNCGVFPGCRWAVFRTPYYVIDGNYVGTQSSPTTYGFILNAPSSCATDYDVFFIGDSSGETTTHITIAHFAADYSGCGAASQSRTIVDEGTSATQGNLLFSHIYCSGCQQPVSTRGTSANDIYEYIYQTNPFSDSTHHGDVINLFSTANPQNCTIRYNTILAMNGTGGIVAENPVIGCNIYGNIITGNVGGNNGVITTTTGDYWQNAIITNNVFTNNSGTNATFAGCLSGDASCTNATGNVFEDNIVYNQPCAFTGGSTQTHDYNSYLSCTDTAPTDTHGQVQSFNPFVNAATNNYALTAAPVASCSSSSAICGGLSQSGTYTIDLVGNTYGTNGQWERGAYAFVAPQSSAPFGTFFAGNFLLLGDGQLSLK